MPSPSWSVRWLSATESLEVHCVPLQKTMAFFKHLLHTAALSGSSKCFSPLVHPYCRLWVVMASDSNLPLGVPFFLLIFLNTAHTLINSHHFVKLSSITVRVCHLFLKGTLTDADKSSVTFICLLIPINRRMFNSSICHTPLYHAF